MSDKIIEVAYVTKWALTRGIIEVHGAEVTDSEALFYRQPGGLSIYASRSQWFPTRREANAELARLMKKEIARLKVRIGVLENSLAVLAKARGEERSAERARGE